MHPHPIGFAVFRIGCSIGRGLAMGVRWGIFQGGGIGYDPRMLLDSFRLCCLCLCLCSRLCFHCYFLFEGMQLWRVRQANVEDWHSHDFGMRIEFLIEDSYSQKSKSGQQWFCPRDQF